MEAIWIILILLVISVVFFIAIYNSLVRLKVIVNEAWSDIQVQMKRRYDMIPNLVETVKGYAKHESETLEKVIQARNAAMANQGNPSQQAKDENVLSGTLKSIFALSENYPDLKANQNFLELQRELVDTEDKIQASRRFYNMSVKDFNTKIQTFPSNMIAGMFHFEKREFFELEEEAAKKPVAVKF